MNTLNSSLISKTLLGLAALVATGTFSLGEAHAEDVNRALAVPHAGDIKIDVNAEMSLADGAFLEPLSLAPDIYYGINEDIAVGLVHSATSQGIIGVGPALRVRGGDAFGGTGLEAFYTFLRGSSLDLSAQAGLFFDSFDPDVWMTLKAGAIARTSIGPVELAINPYIRLPLTESSVRSNQIMVPVWGYYELTPDLDLSIITGLNDEALQLGAGVSYDLPGPVDLGAHLGFPRLAGEGSAADVLAANVYASFSL